MLVSYPMLPETTPDELFQQDSSFKPVELPKDDRSKLRDESATGSSRENENSSFDHELIDQPIPVTIPALSRDELAQFMLEQQATHGTYPISHDKRWHAGIHLSASKTAEPIRAIADGCIVAARHSSKSISGKNGAICDNGFVLLKHSTEIGARRIPGTDKKSASVEPITFTYFSLYIHLASQEACDASGLNRVTALARPLRKLKVDSVETYPDPKSAPRVNRRDILGWAGKMYGQGLCHHEVFTSESELKKIFPDTSALVKQKKSSDRLPWGKLYFYVPPKTTLLASPTRAKNGFISVNGESIKSEIVTRKVTEEKTTTDKNGKTKTQSVSATKKEETGRYYDSVALRSVFFPQGTANSCSTALVVEMWFHKGSRYFRVLKPVDATETRWQPSCDKVFAMESYEYKLFERALRMYSDGPSAGMDLMRFGRSIGIDEPPKSQADSWLAIPYGADPAAQGYVDLASSAVLKYSDADFPHFSGWQVVQDSANQNDGKVDVKALLDQLQLADANKDGKTDENEWISYLKNSPVAQQVLRKMICKAPAEWDAQYNESRYGQLKQVGGAFEGKEKSYQEFSSFIQKFQFWGEIKGALSGHGVTSSILCYFHPLQFVKHFRKANWLSVDEMLQLTPMLTQRYEDPLGKGQPKGAPELSYPEFSVAARCLTAGNPHPGSQFVPTGLCTELNWACIRFGIDNAQRKAHFWAQILQETGLFTLVTEGGKDSYFDKYEPTTKTGAEIGNTEKGDGLRFKGRGLIQLTGKGNYRAYSKFRNTVDYTIGGNNEKLAADAYVTCDTSGFYWACKSRGRYQNINSFADVEASEKQAKVVTHEVNPGYAHYKNRQDFFAHAYHALNDATVVPAKYYEMSEKAYEEYKSKEAVKAAEKKKVGKQK